MLTPIKTLVIAALYVVAVSTSFAADLNTRPTVYLTFDDGPSADSSTEALLDVLGLYGVTATFFVTGQRALMEPEKISSVLYAGHAIGNHSHSHIALAGEPHEGIVDEFNRANRAVLDAGGPPMTCYRPPFGLSDTGVERAGAALGMTSVKWSIDTRDWESRTVQGAIVDALNNITDGSIVLMHDGPSRRAKTIAALTDWLDENAHRYQFSALPQCKPYGTSEVFASIDDQEIDLPLEQESIQSLLEKIRSYRFSFQMHESEQVSAEAAYDQKLAVKVF